jgi:ATP/maltotriose-dependent transcriptional regulator MalT/DNA-binding SARP family transcriptional activator
MSRSFRFVPPEPRADVLVRPRLLRSLVGRWEHRVTSVVGGAGLGKTTLLAQAVAENRLAPRGVDVWIGVEPGDSDAAGLAAAVVVALAGETEGAATVTRVEGGSDPEAVAGLVWRRSPVEVCLLFDDIHLLPEGSAGASWLEELVEALPTNGHVVVAGRVPPPLRLARWGARWAMAEIGESGLRFTGEELAAFGAEHGLDRRRLDATGGWPAMAALTANVGAGTAGAYLWEEVLEPLGPDGRHVLAVVSDVGGADDLLAAAAVDRPVELAPVLRDVPLVARSVDGWFVPHDLWREASGLALTRAERGDVRRRAARHLSRRGRFDEAFGLLAELELWDAVPEVLRAACVASERLAVGQMERWLSAIPREVRDSAEGRLLTGLHTAFARPREAVEPLQDAAARCRARGDLDAEVTAIAELTKLAWWRQDLEALAVLGARVFELDSTGHPTVRALAAFGRALLADMVGDDGAVLAELDSIEPSALDASWRVHVDFMRAVVHQESGDIDLALDLVERSLPGTSPMNRYVLDAVRLVSRWKQGRIDEVVAEVPSVIAAARQTGVRYNLYLGLAMASTLYAHAGDPTSARACFEESLAYAPPLTNGHLTVQLALAVAAIELAEGDEAAAAAALEDAVATHGLHQPGDRRAWINAIALSYVLVPETRKHWDDAALRGPMALARATARAVVAARVQHAGDRPLPVDLEVDDPVAVRGVLHVRLAAELALALSTVGRPQGRELLERLGPAGRTAVRDISRSARHTRPAKALLAAVPTPPTRPTYLGVLGLLAIRRDGPVGEEVLHPARRRQRVLSLLAFLVEHRQSTRGAIAAALWPDLDARAANNNLGVNLTHVLQLLDPGRHSGDPSYVLRLDGPSVRLVTGEHLRVDVDEFDRHLAAAGRAEADAAPSLVLEHHLAAADLYRGDLHADVPDAGWFAVAREHYRARFVRTAVRAGQLLLGRSDDEQAEALARRALAVDQWNEDAYAILVVAALARGDRSAAHQWLTRCLEAVADLGLQPSVATQQLRRRLLGIADPP